MRANGTRAVMRPLPARAVDLQPTGEHHPVRHAGQPVAVVAARRRVEAHASSSTASTSSSPSTPRRRRTAPRPVRSGARWSGPPARCGRAQVPSARAHRAGHQADSIASRPPCSRCRRCRARARGLFGRPSSDQRRRTQAGHHLALGRDALVQVSSGRSSRRIGATVSAGSLRAIQAASSLAAVSKAPSSSCGFARGRACSASRALVR